MTGLTLVDQLGHATFDRCEPLVVHHGQRTTIRAGFNGLVGDRHGAPLQAATLETKRATFSSAGQDGYSVPAAQTVCTSATYGTFEIDMPADARVGSYTLLIPLSPEAGFEELGDMLFKSQPDIIRVVAG